MIGSTFVPPHTTIARREDQSTDIVIGKTAWLPGLRFGQRYDEIGYGTASANIPSQLASGEDRTG